MGEKPRGFVLDWDGVGGKAVEEGHVWCGVCPTTLKGLLAISIRSVPPWEPGRPRPDRVTVPELDKGGINLAGKAVWARISARMRASGTPSALITIW